MKTNIILEDDCRLWVNSGDTLELSHNETVILKHIFTEPIEIFYVGVFEIVGGGFGGYFSTKSQL